MIIRVEIEDLADNSSKKDSSVNFSAVEKTFMKISFLRLYLGIF